jgi:hypothetical protein
MSKTDLKHQAKYYYKKTLAGPGKFAIFLLLCIFTIFSIELIGLSNKESNLEIRSINKRVIPIIKKEEYAKIESNTKKIYNTFDDKLKISTQRDNSRRILMRENILLNGAFEQTNFETLYIEPGFIHDI